MKEKNHLFSATGIPSLFLIFGVLMLVILSLLGYGTSRQDLRASSLSLEQTSAYYNACSEAADFYSDLVQTLEGFQAQVKSESAYYKLVSDYLNSQENVKWDSEEHTAEYMKAFSDTQSLAVKVSVFWTDRTADSQPDPARIRHLMRRKGASDRDQPSPVNLPGGNQASRPPQWPDGLR